MSVDLGQVGTEHRLGRVDQIPYGEARTFEVAGRQVAVFRIRDGRVRALSAKLQPGPARTTTVRARR